MGLRISVVARVGEASAKSSIMLHHLIDDTTTVIDFRQAFGVGLYFGAGVDASLRDGSSGLRCGSRLNRKSWSHHAQHGCGSKREGNFSHWFSPWVNLGEHPFALEYQIWGPLPRSPNYKNRN
jgi:hypothetical protein